MNFGLSKAIQAGFCRVFTEFTEMGIVWITSPCGTGLFRRADLFSFPGVPEHGLNLHHSILPILIRSHVLGNQLA